MGSVAVVTDTTHYMPDEVVERHGIRNVSLYVTFGGRTTRESELPDFDGFYDHLRSASDLPTTSQPSVGDFLAVYEPLLEEGRDIVSVHLAAGLSGTCAAAEQAREALVERGVARERIRVINSRSACGGLGQQALAAANAAAAGEDLDVVEQRVLALRDDCKIWFAVDTLEFLKRGGRIGAARALLGTTLRIKPILTCEDEITPVEKVRTWQRAMERMVDYLRMRREDGCDAWMIQHIQAHEQAAVLVERGREIYGCEPELVSEIGPVIGTHAGPGLVGVSGVRRSLLGSG